MKSFEQAYQEIYEKLRDYDLKLKRNQAKQEAISESFGDSCVAVEQYFQNELAESEQYQVKLRALADIARSNMDNLVESREAIVLDPGRVSRLLAQFNSASGGGDYAPALYTEVTGQLQYAKTEAVRLRERRNQRKKELEARFQKRKEELAEEKRNLIESITAYLDSSQIREFFDAVAKEKETFQESPEKESFRRVPLLVPMEFVPQLAILAEGSFDIRTFTIELPCESPE